MGEDRTHHRAAICLLTALIGTLLLSACHHDATPLVPGGDPEKGKAEIVTYGCGSCHTIPGVAGANGMVGPPLLSWSRRSIIAGELPNTPVNLIRWIEMPQAIEPGTAMPNLGVKEEEAKDIAAYLYTLR